jgi:hypothetical protein
MEPRSSLEDNIINAYKRNRSSNEEERLSNEDSSNKGSDEDMPEIVSTLEAQKKAITRLGSRREPW